MYSLDFGVKLQVLIHRSDTVFSLKPLTTRCKILFIRYLIQFKEK